MGIKKILDKFLFASPKNAFYVIVKCSECGEEVRVRIDRSSDFQVEYNPRNPEHCYTITKEIIGKNCFNLMKLALALSRKAQVLFCDTHACEFITFERESENAA